MKNKFYTDFYIVEYRASIKFIIKLYSDFICKIFGHSIGKIWNGEKDVCSRCFKSRFKSGEKWFKDWIRFHEFGD